METIAFRMNLRHGQSTEYKKRHDGIWGEFPDLRRQSGVIDYRILLDEETQHLIASLTRADNYTMERLPLEPMVRKGWSCMADIMTCEADGTLVQRPLTLMFHLN